MAHRYRLAPTPEQEIVLTRHCADARYVWNLALEQANLYRVERGPTPSAGLRQRQLAEARKATWLGEGSSTVQQQALRDFDQAMRNWWGGEPSAPHLAQGWAQRGILRARRVGAEAQPKVGAGPRPEARLGEIPALSTHAGRARHGSDHTRSLRSLARQLQRPATNIRASVHGSQGRDRSRHRPVEHDV